MIKSFVNKTLSGVKTHSPELLIGVGVVGMISSSVLAVKATPKALDIIEDRKMELDVNVLTRREIVQATWKQYIPAIGVGVVSAACIVAGTTQNIKRNTALATVYAISEGTLKEYQKRTREVVGEEKAREIEKRVVRKQAASKQATIVESNDSEYIHQTGMGDTLFYDTLCGGFFRSSTNAVEAAVNCVNKTILDEGVATANDFYSEMNVPCNGAGNLIGWKYEKGQLEINFDSDMDRFGNPYIILEYRNRPIPLVNYPHGW